MMFDLAIKLEPKYTEAIDNRSKYILLSLNRIMFT